MGNSALGGGEIPAPAPPLVSVVMAAYNAEQYIGEAVNSVAAQTYQSWELIAVDDGSTDRTPELLRALAAGDARIRVLRRANGGVSAARNTGLEAVSGEYLTFLDADDVLPPDSLALQVAYMEQHTATTMLAGAVDFFEDGTGTLLRRWIPSYNGNPLRPLVRLEERVWANPSYLVRAASAAGHRFAEGMTHAEDRLFFAEVAAVAPQHFASVEAVVYRYRVSAGSAMSNLNGLERGYWQFYRAAKALPGVRPADLRYLRRRIVRIMALSYLAKRRVLDAFLSLRGLLA